MTDVALIFPGQGAQYVGMGKELYESSPEAKEIFDQAEKAFGHNGLKDVMFNGPEEKLRSTAYCQPAIATMSIAALKALEAHSKYQEISVKFTAGLSLGEYSALTAAKALSFEDALKLIERRSSFMEQATKMAKGKMAAIIGFEKEKLVEICDSVGAQVANFNSLQQIVITGEAEKVEAAMQKLEEAGAKNIVPLAVSGAFHSTLMQPAVEKFTETLHDAHIVQADVPVVANVNGNPVTDPEDIRKNLGLQITSSVQWVDSIQYIAAQGIKNFIEIGPGRILSGLLRKIDRGLNVQTVGKPEDIESLSFE